MPEIKSNLNGKILAPLIDFDFIVNTELGLIRLIREQYQDDRAFKLEILNKSDREILSLLYSRSNYNPLSIISTESNMDNIDKLYKSFFNEFKKEILLRSVSEYSIIMFIKMALSSESSLGINISITCRDDIEREEIESHFERPKTLERREITSILSKDAYYVKDYKFFEDLKLEEKITHKKIYTTSRKYNMDYFENVTNILTSTNAFVLIGNNYREKHDGIQQSVNK